MVCLGTDSCAQCKEGYELEKDVCNRVSNFEAEAAGPQAAVQTSGAKNTNAAWLLAVAFSIYGTLQLF
jgi:hypothetical protein